ncbi:MAG: GTPase ObgE [Clostridiaceae bacterium]|nr:GTPase ObgE [Clostridiaceae bacterium]
MFVDLVNIHVKAGRGGDGSVNFHREKYVAAGGPDGGDGGRGGNIVFVTDSHMTTLLDFRYTRKYTAENGNPGSGKRCFGKDAGDVVIRVPVGTLIREAKSGQLMADMAEGQRFVAAKGGRGGWGNAHFATSTRQAPRFAKPGLPGEEFDLILELKMIADVGLIGFPNVGKSTLLSVISAATPKIANYPFTTLSPNLGVVGVDRDKSFVAADIPGLIEGASHGAGLGFHFLRHIERCRLLIHVVDVSCVEGRDPIQDYEAINSELAGYSERLTVLPQIVAANKSDIVQDEAARDAFYAYLTERHIPYYEISALARIGLQPLLYAAAQKLDELPPVEIFVPDYVPAARDTSHEFEITVEDGVYNVRAEWLQRAYGNLNFDDYESRMHFESVLEKYGLFEKLEDMGIQEGDTVKLYDLVFDYVK